MMAFDPPQAPTAQQSPGLAECFDAELPPLPGNATTHACGPVALRLCDEDEGEDEAVAAAAAAATATAAGSALPASA